MSKQGKEYLKDVFSKGSLPTESNFRLLIDSMFNLEDDDLRDLLDGALKLYVKNNEDPDTKNGALLEFFKDIADTKSASSWRFSLSDTDEKLQVIDSSDRVVLEMDQKGNVSFDAENIDLKGKIIRSGTEGSYINKIDSSDDKEYPNQVKADGEWKTIIEEEDCQLFEVVAGVGSSDSKSYALLRATVSLVPKEPFFYFFTPKNRQIQVTQSYSGSSRNKLDLKWTKKKGSNMYCLQLRSRKDFGGNTMISYHITNLWFDPKMSQSIPSKNSNNIAAKATRSNGEA